MRLKLPSALPALATAAVLSVSAFSGLAQSSSASLATPVARISGPVSSAALVTLKGNTHPLAQARYDQGAAPASLATGKMQLLFRRSAAQQSALAQYMGGLQDPHSASYRKWLTPATYGASFGIADPDLQAIEAWLQSEGFKIEAVPASRNFIQFSGTAGQLGQAFHTSIHSYLINGVRHYSNASDPQIPAALAPVVAGVSPMNDFRPKPMHVLGGHAQVQAKGGSLQVLSATKGAGASPELTGTIDNTSVLFVTPSDAATIYNAPNALNRTYTGGTQQMGSGVNVGVVEDSDLQVTDYLNYRTLFLNETSPASPTIVVDGVDPGVTPGDAADEALLDAELVAGLAPEANLYVYSSADDALQDGAYDAALRAVEDNNVAVLSVSFGACEADLGASGNQQFNELWQQAAAQGISVLVAAGDTGSASCDAEVGGPTAVDGLSVSGFATTPYNTAVGGTDFDVLGISVADFNQYVGAATTQNSFFGTALSYIPENPWNDSISNNPPGSYTTNTAQQYPTGTGSATTTIVVGTGGGASSAAVCSGAIDDNGNCTGTLSGYPTPSFQSGLAHAGTAPTGVRYIPDVSLFAAPGNLRPVTWAFCSDNVTDGTSTARTDCVANAQGEFGVSGIGGTSASTPAFAGVLAQVINSLATTGTTRLGIANNTLYNLFATSTNSAVIFHDITAGNNAQPCAAGALNCATNGFLAGYDAGTGYDLASGLGSVNIGELINNWDLVQFTPTSLTLAANGSTAAINVQHGTAVTLSTQVTPTTATGTVGVTATTTGQAGAAVNEAIPLTGGAGSIAVNDLPGGSYSIQAYYQGDVKDSPSLSSQPIPVVITPEASSPFLSLAIYDFSSGNAITTNPVPFGAYGFAYINPANSNAGTVGSHGFATGSATLLNNGDTLSTQTLNSEGVAAFPLINLTPGTYSLGATYAGDSSYDSSATTATQSLVIAKGPTQLIVHTGTATAGASTLTVELDTDSGSSTLPTGAVTLTVNGTNLTGTATAVVLPDGADELLVTYALPAGTLLSTANTLAASYPGDNNYGSSTAASCTFTPAVLAASNDHQPISPAHTPLRVLLAGGSAMVLCSALFFAIPARRRAWRGMLVVFFALGLMGAVGCGGTSNSSGGGGGTGTTLPTCTK